MWAACVRRECFLWAGQPNIRDFNSYRIKPTRARAIEETTAARVLLLCHNAMAGLLELEPAAALATVLESESTGRERRVRGFYFGKSEHGRWRWATAAAAAMVMATGSSRRAQRRQK